MALNVPEAPELVTPGNVGDELASFTRAMRAANVSPNTIHAYGGAVRLFGQWLMDHDYPTDVEAIEARHVEEFITSILETRKATTAHQRWRGLQRFFGWYADHADDDYRSPMAKLHPPRLPKMMPRVLTLDEVRAVLGTATSTGFEDRRDNALIRLLFDTGARRHELAALRYNPADPNDRDLDVRRETVRVIGKGTRENLLPVGNRTMLAMEDYLRVRRKHPHADLPWLWLGKRGQLTDSGIAQMIRDRGARVGLANLHAHDFRHAATHHELAAGMSESDVMAKRGWESTAMLRRYASTTRNARMIDASRKLGLGDKV